MSQDSKLLAIKEMVLSAESSLAAAKRLLTELINGNTESPSSSSTPPSTAHLQSPKKEGENTIIEGIFNGQLMTDKDGKEYPIPANYASKSKLVSGDVLKLTIQGDGAFLFKQIGPIPRKTIIGTLAYEDSQYKVIADGKAYKVILASVTYFKGEVGDKVTLVVPAQGDSEWAAIENILPHE